MSFHDTFLDQTWWIKKQFSWCGYKKYTFLLLDFFSISHQLLPTYQLNHNPHSNKSPLVTANVWEYSFHVKVAASPLPPLNMIILLLGVVSSSIANTPDRYSTLGHLKNCCLLERRLVCFHGRNSYFWSKIGNYWMKYFLSIPRTKLMVCYSRNLSLFLSHGWCLVSPC